MLVTLLPTSVAPTDFDCQCSACTITRSVRVAPAPVRVTRLQDRLRP